MRGRHRRETQQFAGRETQRPTDCEVVSFYLAGLLGGKAASLFPNPNLKSQRGAAFLFFLLKVTHPP